MPISKKPAERKSRALATSESGTKSNKRPAPVAKAPSPDSSDSEEDENEEPAPPRKKSKATTSITKSNSMTRKKASSPLDTPSKIEATANDYSAEEEEENGDDHLHGFSSGSDSSDSDEEGGVQEVALDISKLPTVAKDDATVKRKLERAKKLTNVDRGVVYVGRIPHGFYEDEMRGYFSQFGEVTRVRLSRSKKTGRSKHYGFLEFSSSPVAEIVCETMDNYLLMGHLLSCKMVPKEKVHPDLWIGANRKWRKVPMDRVVRVVHNRERTAEERQTLESTLLKRQRKKQRKINEAGIDYDLTPVGYKPVVV